jgi:hypothetical protein
MAREADRPVLERSPCAPTLDLCAHALAAADATVRQFLRRTGLVLLGEAHGMAQTPILADGLRTYPLVFTDVVLTRRGSESQPINADPRRGDLVRPGN